MSYQNVDDFFTLELVKEANQHWQATLGVLVRELSESGTVLDETKQLVLNLLK